MINILDRLPAKPNRRLITPEGNGTPFYATVIRADDPEEDGTAINRALLMAMQGFCGSTTTFNPDGSVTETNQDGDTLVTVLNLDGTVDETFTVDGVSIRKHIAIVGNVIEEVLV